MKVNGWKNYPTWIINLYFGDEFTRIIEEKEMGWEIMNPYDLAEAMENYVDEFFYDEEYDRMPCGWKTDLTGFAYERVDWYDIAECYAINKEIE